LNQWERENEKLENLRTELNVMATTLGVCNIEVLRLSQEMDILINVIQRRMQSKEVIDCYRLPMRHGG